MPLPKDPVKLEEYRKKMSEIAKARGYGLWMKGKKASDTTKAKMRSSQLARITPTERKTRSKRAKALGYGLWMRGRKAYPKFVQQSKARKGKTYSEIYGAERAEKEALKRQKTNQRTSRRKVKEGAWPPENFLNSALVRSGKTYTDIYGEGRAEEESKKRSDAHLKKWEGKLRKGCRDKVNGEHKYKVWRTAVFTRDNYTCQGCHRRGGRLHAHHKRSWAKYPRLRYQISNGVTLCPKCHGKRHPKNKALINA